MKGTLFVPVLGLISNIAMAAGSSAAPAPSSAPITPPSLTRQTSILGKTFGVSFSTVPNSTQTGTVTKLDATILGKKKSLIQASVFSSADLSQAGFQSYINGVQLGSAQGSFTQKEWKHKLTIPPVNVKSTFLSIPLGPIAVEVGGGFSLSGNLDANVQLGSEQDQSVIPQSVQTTLDSSVQSASFVDGSVKYLVVRGGVKGQLGIADGKVESKGEFHLGKGLPTVSAKGTLAFLSGAVSAFADYYGFFSGWKRFWSATLFSWKGYCYNFDTKAQVNGKCVAR